MHGAGDPHAALAAVGIAERPEAALRRVRIREARVRRQVLRHARLAMPREIGRRRAADELGDADLARDEVLAADGADSHRRVEAFVDEIDDAVRKLDVEAHLAETAP